MSCTRRLEWDMGHRVPLHGGKCRNPHGHRYAIEVTCRADTYTPEGFVVDFSIVKQLVGGWIDEHLDHAFAVQRGDPLEGALAAADLAQGAPSKLFIMADPPTAECLADLLFVVSTDLLKGHRVRVENVRVYETPNCWADAP